MSRAPPRSVRPLVGLPAVVAANLLPLVGVVAWGWNLGTLLVLYWLEAAATVFLAALKSLFAERGSTELTSRVEPLHELRAKRGGWRIRPEWPPVYPRNVPFALSVLGSWCLTVLPVSVLYWASADLSVPLSPGLRLSVAALVFGHAAAFVTDYVGEGRYREVSAQELVGPPTLLVAVVAFLGLLSAGGGAATGFAVLVVVVLGKTAVSAARFYTDRLDGSWAPLDGVLPGPEASRPPPEIDRPDDPVSARVGVDARAVLAGSVVAIGYGFATRVGYLSVGAFAFSLLTGDAGVVALAAVPVLVVAAARVLSYYLRYGTIEYQRRGDALVAYDTVLEEPQWVADVHRTEFSVRNAVVGRLLGTGTLELSGVDAADHDPVRFGPVSDVDAAVTALELPVSRTDRPDRDPAVVVAGIGLAATFLAVPAALALSSRVDARTAVGLLVAFGPLFLLPIGLLVWAGLSRL